MTHKQVAPEPSGGGGMRMWKVDLDPMATQWYSVYQSSLEINSVNALLNAPAVTAEEVYRHRYPCFMCCCHINDNYFLSTYQKYAERLGLPVETRWTISLCCPEVYTRRAFDDLSQRVECGEVDMQVVVDDVRNRRLSAHNPRPATTVMT
jgi:hypothetical protein